MVKLRKEKKEAKVPEGAELTRARRMYAPDVDIIQKDDNIILIADMPGVDEKSVDITLEKDILTIRGEVKMDIPENYKIVYAEFGVGDYLRSFTLPDDIDRDKIQATVKNGVLKLIMPKAETAKAKKITVKAEE
ncbi:MAG: Hsp20/alpha crystallin family protein [Nitrospirae bacterium]|nr:MAG: Hsp20/alpha crystallin family protein [Nitrospirota bacterium]